MLNARQFPILALALACALYPAHHGFSQSTLNNPLLRPHSATRDPALPTPPPGAPAGNNNPGRNEGPVQAKSLQEEVTANQQKLNAERVPMPLRVLLATVYVSAINGKTAVLRQPLPQTQQAVLASPGTGFGQGLPGAIPGAFPGAAPGGFPGALPGATPGAMPGAIPGATPGAVPGAPLSAGTGLFNPFAFPPPRPTSIRVRDGQPFSLQGYELTAHIREQEVTLLWKNAEDTRTIVFQSGIESPSLPAYVPPAATLERPDNGYFGRVQAGSAGSSGGSGSSAPSSGSGAR